jgi:hypothetical protein
MLHNLKDLIAAYDGNCMLSHLDVIQNRLNPDTCGDCLLGQTTEGIPRIPRTDPGICCLLRKSFPFCERESEREEREGEESERGGGERERE